MLASRVEFDPAPSIGSKQIMGYDPRRLTLRFNPPGAGSVTLSTDVIDLAGHGIVLTPNSGSLYLTVATDGEVVQRAWYALYSGVGNPVSWIQGIG